MGKAIESEGRGDGTTFPGCCNARNRNGLPCRRRPTPGKRRCYYHGGAKGSGGPPTTFLYRRHLPDEQRDVFDRAVVDSLDDEIRLAKANLDTAVQSWSEDPHGGVIQSSGKEVIRERLWVDIVREHIETVRRLLEAKARISGEDHSEAKGALKQLMEQVVKRGK